MEEKPRDAEKSGGPEEDLGALEERLRVLSIARRTRPVEPAYLLDLAFQRGGGLAVACSDFTVRLHDSETLQLRGECHGHQAPLCGITPSHSTVELLYSGSADGTVRAWDLRVPGSGSVQTFCSKDSYSLCSLDLSCSDTLLCAGTEQVDQEDSYLLFWDPRKDGTLLGAYSESHSDDVTQVRFHPKDKDRMASGSTDGLVNVFDLSQGAEDEALLATCNSDSSASSVCWCGPGLDQLLCLSHDEGLHLWDLSCLHNDQAITRYSTPDARSLPLLSGEACLDYLIGGQWLEDAQKLLVVGGTNMGVVHLTECDNKGLHLLRSLEGGHTATVRCFLWDAAGESLVTGGEDGQLLQWRPGGAELTVGKQQSLKSQSTLKLKSRPHHQHGRTRNRKAPS
ncbi:WD repeat-containing protein 89 [Neosynchiropus ocellatus]